MPSNILTAAKVVVLVNNVVLGKCTSFSYSVSTPRTELRGIDSITPFELMPTMSIISGDISVIKLISDGAAEGLGMSVPLPNLPASKYFSIILMEIPTGNIIFSASACALDAQRWGFNAKGVVTGSFSWKSIDYANEVPAATF